MRSCDADAAWAVQEMTRNLYQQFETVRIASRQVHAVRKLFGLLASRGLALEVDSVEEGTSEMGRSWESRTRSRSFGHSHALGEQSVFGLVVEVSAEIRVAPVPVGCFRD